MDHIVQPNYPSSPPTRVAYVAEPYDGGRFLEYQTRHPAFDGSRTRDEMQSYMQTWLYFGLLYEILGPDFSLEDYITHDEQGPAVSTKTLHRDFSSWIKRTWQMGNEQRDNLANHICECFTMWNRAIRICDERFRSMSDQGLSTFPYILLDFDRGFRQSLGALGEKLYRGFKDAFKGDRRILPILWSHLYADKTTVIDLQRCGWCPFQATRFLRDGGSVEVNHFAERLSMSSPNQPDRHRFCTIQLCQHMQIDPTVYTPAHVGLCGCTEIGPDISDVEACFANDSFPVLRVSGCTVDDVKVEAVQYSDRMLYVAISHIWADGLGNPFAMKLPRCQLLRLQKLTQTLRKDQQDLLLWCDTLCCPVELHLKPLALAKIRDVYRLAAHVLILDRSLLPYTYDNIGPIEASIRLLASPWTSRLWTLQEGTLARSLLVQFADRAVDVDHLRWESDEGYGRYWKTLAIGRGLMGRLDKVRNIGQNEGFADKARFMRVIDAVGDRRVSFQSDEALCLATLFGVDLSQVASASPADRMKVLWRLLSDSPHGIPKGIVFNFGFARVDQAGFRWAPASVMLRYQELTSLTTAYLTDARPENKGLVTKQGIRVSFPAWEVKPSRNADRNMPCLGPGNSCGPLSNVPWLQHSAGHWYSLGPLAQDWAAGNPTTWRSCAFCKKCVLIFDKLPTVTEPVAQGLLGSVVPGLGGEELVRGIAVVGLKLATIEQQARLDLAMIAGNTLWQKLDDWREQLTDQDAKSLGLRLMRRVVELAQQNLEDARNSESEHVTLGHEPIDDQALKLQVLKIITLFEGFFLTVGDEYPADKTWTID